MTSFVSVVVKVVAGLMRSKFLKHFVVSTRTTSKRIFLCAGEAPRRETSSFRDAFFPKKEKVVSLLGGPMRKSDDEKDDEKDDEGNEELLRSIFGFIT